MENFTASLTHSPPSLSIFIFVAGALLPLAERRGAQGAAHLLGPKEARGTRPWRGAAAVR